MCKPLVLLIEDLDDHAQMVRDRLEWAGCEVVRATGPRDGIALARSARPRFIVLDLDLGQSKHEGIEVLEALDADHALTEVPVIVLSIHAQNDDQVRPIRKGARWSIDKNAPNALALLEALIERDLRWGSGPRKTDTRPETAAPLWYNPVYDRLSILGAVKTPSGLSERESKVMALLCERAGEVCTWEDLADVAGGETPETIDKMMYRLKKHLTELGGGAQFVERLSGSRWMLLTEDAVPAAASAKPVPAAGE